jgi:hypothetical protein
VCFVIVNNFLLTSTNTLAFNITDLITDVKSFVIQPSGQVQSTFKRCNKHSRGETKENTKKNTFSPFERAKAVLTY